VLVGPAVLEAADGRRREPRCILAEQGGERLGEVAARDALQIEDRQQRLDRLRAAHVGWQDCRPEADAGGIVAGGPAVAHTRLPDGDRPDPGHHLALGQMAVAHEPPAASLGLEIGMAGEELRDLGLDRLRQQGPRSAAQDLGEPIFECSWLNQPDNVIVRHGISLLRWRSEVVKQPHDMPPSRFDPSPTSGDSSAHRGAPA
jgi:hypothetical protein